jgi:hypothetical protein
MALSFEIQQEGQLVFARMSEEISPKQLTEAFLANQEKPEFLLHLPRLVDTSAVTDIRGGFTELFGLYSVVARHYKAHDTTMYLAIFAPSDYIFGLVRIFQNLSDGGDTIKTRIFREMPAARAWALEHSQRSTASG